MAMNLKFCGGVGTVSGSMHLATTDKSEKLKERLVSLNVESMIPKKNGTVSLG